MTTCSGVMSRDTPCFSTADARPSRAIASVRRERGVSLDVPDSRTACEHQPGSRSAPPVDDFDSAPFAQPADGLELGSGPRELRPRSCFVDIRRSVREHALGLLLGRQRRRLVEVLGAVPDVGEHRDDVG